MGLSVHYSGTIRSMTLVNHLIDETADICESMYWNYRIITEPGDEGLNGIVFSPENCEPVFLTFLPNGRMCSPINLMNKNFYTLNGFDPDLTYTTSTKTQFAGPDTHIALLKLLRYLKEKYFGNFELDDEGYYWGTNDEKILSQRFDEYNQAISTVKEVLTEMHHIPSENAESLTKRIEDVLKKKFGKKD
jgi:hypothetical protein